MYSLKNKMTGAPYQAPSCKKIEVEVTTVLCQSSGGYNEFPGGNVPGFEDGGIG